MDVVDFATWYRREHPRLASTLVIVAGDAGLAADAADEAFARAYERWGRVGLMASPGGWTYRTALNVLRRRRRRERLEATLLRRHPTGPRSGGLLAPPSDWSPEVWDALRSLPRRERTAVALRYVADLSTDQIAEAMGVAPGTVGSTLHAARRHLAAALGDEPDPDIELTLAGQEAHPDA
jgi:DNA-directed RNA polymerase specialized sigma24 family protein